MSIFMFGKKKDNVIEEPSFTKEEIQKIMENIHLEPNTYSPPEIISLDINTKRIKRLMWRNALRP